MILLLKNIREKLDAIFEKIAVLIFAVYTFIIPLKLSTFIVTFSSFDLISEIVKKLCLLIFLFLTAYYIFTLHFDKIGTIISAIFYLFFLISYYYGKNGEVLLLYTFAVIGNFVSVEKILKAMFIGAFSNFVMLMVLSIIHIIPDYKNILYKHNESKEIARAFGYTDAHVSAEMYLEIMVFYFYLRKNKIKLFEIILAVIISTIFFIYNDRRNIIICVLLCLFITVFLKYNKNKILEKLYYFYGIVCFPFCFIITIITLLLYSNNIPIMLKLDRLLSGRLSLAVSGIEKFKIGIFSQHIEHNIGTYDWIDSGFVKALVEYGLIITIILLVAYTLIGFMAKIKNKKYIVMCLIIYSYYSITDPGFTNPMANPFLLFSIIAIYDTIAYFNNKHHMIQN